MNPLDRFLDPRPHQRTDREDATVADAARLLALEDLAHEAFLDANDLDAVLPVLFVGQHQDRHPCDVGMLQDRLQDLAALVQPPKRATGRVDPDHLLGEGGIGRARRSTISPPRRRESRDIRILTDVGAIDDEDDGVTAGVVTLPETSHGDLTADIPDLQVHIRQGEGRNVLADSGGGFAGIRGGSALGTGEKEGLDLGEEGGFASIVEAEKEDGVFWAQVSEWL